MKYQTTYFDISNKNESNLFDFFMGSLIEPVYNSCKKGKIKLLPFFKQGNEGYLVSYLASTLVEFVFYENRIKNIEKLRKIMEENETKQTRNLFYDFLLFKSQGDEILLNKGLFKKGYSDYLGSRFYFQASQIRMKIDHRATPLSLALRNISFYFNEFSEILHEAYKNLR
ncbi:MAG: hypothetical protein N3G19_01655 [Candidatus Pacearchaeota archaeon]|nr:hypothetical protein [Candidatus Pacearchaeota archaeon]